MSKIPPVDPELLAAIYDKKNQIPEINDQKDQLDENVINESQYKQIKQLIVQTQDQLMEREQTDANHDQMIKTVKQNMQRLYESLLALEREQNSMKTQIRDNAIKIQELERDISRLMEILDKNG